MAGFFGMFNFTKEGPGVDKTGPQKRGAVVFFEIFGRKFWKLMIAALLYSIPTLACLLVLMLQPQVLPTPQGLLGALGIILLILALTSGPATVGMTYIARNFARQKHAFVVADFFDVIKRNKKQAIGLGACNTILQALMLYAMWFYQPFFTGAEPSFLQSALFAMMLFANILFIFMKYYQYMMLITFKFTFRQLYRNSFIFSIVGLKKNLIIALPMLLVYGILFVLAWYGGLVGLLFAIILLLTVVPCFRMLLIQFNIFPLVKKYIIDPYYKEHPNEDVEKRRDLALEPTEEEVAQKPPAQEEVIFKDTGKTKTEETAETVRNFPKQYTEAERRKARRLTRDSANDDDDTI